MNRLPQMIFHASNTMIIAYGLSRGKFLSYYLLAVSIHAVYNLIVGSSTLLIAGIALMGGTIYFAYTLYSRTSERFFEKI